MRALHHLTLFLGVSYLLTLSSCRTHVKDFESRIKVDTLYVSRDVVVVPEVRETFTIEQICDTVEGAPEVREIVKVFTIGEDTIRLHTENNSLRLEIKALERIKFQRDSVTQILEEVRTSSSQGTKYRTPWAVWLALVALFGTTVTLAWLHFKP